MGHGERMRRVAPALQDRRSAHTHGELAAAAGENIDLPSTRRRSIAGSTISDQPRIEAIGYGAVVLRRRSAAANWVRLDDIPIDGSSPRASTPCASSRPRTSSRHCQPSAELLDERFELSRRTGSSRSSMPRTAVSTCRARRSCSPRVWPSGGPRPLDRGAAPTLRPAAVSADVLASAAADLRPRRRRARTLRAGCAAVVRRLLELGFLVRTEDGLEGLVLLDVPAGLDGRAERAVGLLRRGTPSGSCENRTRPDPSATRDCRRTAGLVRGHEEVVELEDEELLLRLTRLAGPSARPP